MLQKEIDCVLRPSEGKKGCLYIGNLPAAEDIKRLKELNIKAVITAVNVNILQLKDLYKEAGISHYVIDVADRRDINIQDHFEQTYQFIEKNLKLHGVLVHCYVGVSRSATIVLAYLMQIKNFTYQKALHFLKLKRPDVMPNVGFIQKLLDYEEKVVVVKNKKKKAKNGQI